MAGILGSFDHSCRALNVEPNMANGTLGDAGWRVHVSARPQWLAKGLLNGVSD